MSRQVMAVLRNVAISLLRLCGAKNIASATHHYAARPALANVALPPLSPSCLVLNRIPLFTQLLLPHRKM